jgi:WS/DGAT/MGAT family acyltransferase
MDLRRANAAGGVVVLAHADRLTALNASFLAIEDRGVAMHVAFVLIFDAKPLTRAGGGLEVEPIERFVDAGLHDIPRYRQRIVYTPIERWPHWVDDENFNLRYHVRHTRLPRPGDERQLKRLVGRLMSEKLDREKPLWEIWVIEGLEADRFALVAKTHHCMIDGVAGVDLLATLLSASPEPEVREHRPWQPRPAPGPADMLLEAARRPLRGSRSLLQSAGEALQQPAEALRSLRDSAAAVAEMLGSGLSAAPAMPINPHRIGPHRRFDWLRFDLTEVKEIKNRLGGSVNDVALATVAGAMGPFLRRRGTRPEGLEFRALVPFNVRGEDQHGNLGNRIVQLLAPLPVGEPDPLRRLEQVIETMAALKHSRQVSGGEILGQISDWVPGLLDRLLDLALQVGTYNMVVTNVPGPQLPLYLQGAPLLEAYPMVPLFANQALGIALFSYDGSLYWGLNSDWDRVPDLHDLADALLTSFEELRKAAASAPVSAEAEA